MQDGTGTGVGAGEGGAAGDGALALFEKSPLVGPPVGPNALLETGAILGASTTKKHCCFEGG